MQCLSKPIKTFITSILFITSLLLSSTYEAVQENSDIHWKFQRYEILKETENFCYLPPPMNLFYYTITKPISILIKFYKQRKALKLAENSESLRNEIYN